MSSSVSARLNADLLERQYSLWKQDPQAVDATWGAFFEGFELGMAQPPRRGEATEGAGVGPRAGTLPSEDLSFRARVANLVFTYRAIGHTAVWLDPLSPPPALPAALTPEAMGFTREDLATEVATKFFRHGKPMLLGEMIDELRSIYCDRIGFEFAHIQNAEVRDWLLERIEARPVDAGATPQYKEAVLRWLVEAELFERFLHAKYVGQKRFSIEGGESLMVALQSVLEEGGALGVREIVMGMAHRGRLSVLAAFLKKPLKVLLHEFSENYVPVLVAGDGDVKYHLGYEITRRTASGHDVIVNLAANPSHLEAVNAVVEGKVRARQRALGDTADRRQVVPLLVHGDAAFAGQGTVAEVLNLSQLQGYRTGGTLHLIVNNQIGFTTMPADARSSAYATDVAKMIEAPVFHVNGDHPLEVLFASRLALEFRQKFNRDVVIDMYCYRKYGHNEGDEPAFTQPHLVSKIKTQPSVATLFRQRLIDRQESTTARLDAVYNDVQETLNREYLDLRELEAKGEGGGSFADATAELQPEYAHDPVVTGIDPERLRALGLRITEVPDGFRVHPRVRSTVLHRRRKAAEDGGPFDWANAEHLAFASLLTEGIGVRLSGQDSRRGTFSQRHSYLYDLETRDRYCPLQHLAPDQARYCAYNSLLSEAAVLGFDYGYSLLAKNMLILWEAQFGDFANGAQVIIDQFIAAAESKWGQPSGLVLLLPHGYEGQGPEHSSARLERFLQLCAGGNMQVANLTTPAQYFHLLRRQMKRPFRKPLIIMTPKSLLRDPRAVSTAEEMTGETRFHEVLDDDRPIAAPSRITRLIFCSGKVYYDLQDYREENKIKNVALIRLEQIYPFHADRIAEIVAHYPRANKKWVWCQEEPLNMGAWGFVYPRLEKLSRGANVRYAGRDRSASTAAGSKAVHTREQQRLVEEAFSV
ncbi:MAG: 2-oxoglutarate dehydrogenase E1 component [Verrucomicrobiales bacterium]